MMAPALIECGIIFEGVFFGVESTNAITLAPEELSEETLHNWSGGTNQMNHTSKARPIRPKKPPTAPPTTAPRSSAMLLWLPWLLLLPSPPPLSCHVIGMSEEERIVVVVEEKRSRSEIATPATSQQLTKRQNNRVLDLLSTDMTR